MAQNNNDATRVSVCAQTLEMRDVQDKDNVTQEEELVKPFANGGDGDDRDNSL